MDVRHKNQVPLSRRWSLSPRTLERWRWLKAGPQYLKIGGRVVYRLADVEAFENSQLYLSNPSRAEGRIAWTSEYPLYRRDEKGRPNDDDCPLVACTALLAPIAPGLSPEDESATDGEQWSSQGRSAVTGY